MKKIIVTILMVIVTIMAMAEPTIAKYKMNGKDLNIEYSINSEIVYIMVGDYSVLNEDAYIMIPRTDIPVIREFFSQTLKKYIEWSDNVRTSGITDFMKVIPVNKVLCPVCWKYGNEWHVSKSFVELESVFLSDKGKNVMGVRIPVIQSMSNEYIEYDQKTLFVFDNVAEVKALIGLLTDATITNYLDVEKRRQEVFK